MAFLFMAILWNSTEEFAFTRLLQEFAFSSLPHPCHPWAGEGGGSMDFQERADRSIGQPVAVVGRVSTHGFPAGCFSESFAVDLFRHSVQFGENKAGLTVMKENQRHSPEYCISSRRGRPTGDDCGSRNVGRGLHLPLKYHRASGTLFDPTGFGHAFNPVRSEHFFTSIASRRRSSTAFQRPDSGHGDARRWSTRRAVF